MADSQRLLDYRAFWGLWLLIAAAGPLASSGSAAPPSPEREDARPGWVARRSEKPERVWTEWRNALAPRGGQVVLDLATDSQTDYTIVIPAKPTAITRRAAEELQYWLRRVTGADFAIQPDSSPLQPREISVGQTNRLAGVSPHALATAGLEAVDRLPAEGYAVIVDGERLLLTGDGTMSPLIVVMAFLEEDLGLRWYEPEPGAGDWKKQSAALAGKRWPEGTVRVPAQPTLRLGVVPRGATPGFPIRVLRWERSLRPWAIRNRLNGGYASQWGQRGYVTGKLSSHTFHTLVPPETYFAEHPEWYSLVNGKRQWKEGQLCLSNPDVAATASGTLATILASTPAAQRSTRQLVSISVMDHEGDCECAACQARATELGGRSGLVLEFVNRVAERLAPDFPWVTLTTLVYRQSKQPPVEGMRAHPNVAIRFCTDFGASFTWPYHSLRDDHLPDIRDQRDWFDRWQTISPRIHTWIYPHQYRHTLVSMPSLEPVAENLRFFHERGVESAYVQQMPGHDLGREPLRFWVFAKLLWDPSLDVDELVQDFVWGTYGKAAPAVLEYERFLAEQYAAHGDFERRRNWVYPIHNESMLRHDFGPRAREILGRALAAADTPEVARRVERLLVGVVYAESVQLFMQMRDGDAPPDVERYEAVTDELADLCRRLAIKNVGFYDGKNTIQQSAAWLAALRTERDKRLSHLTEFEDAADGTILSEDFTDVAAGGLPDGWRRVIQERDGHPCGVAGVTHYFQNQRALQLRDSRANVAVWSASDELLPDGDAWVMQFDFLLGGDLVFQSSGLGEKQPAGALVGLKRGTRQRGEFLPLVQVENGGKRGAPVRLLAFGEVVADDVKPNMWHRLVIERQGEKWRISLDGNEKQTVPGPDTMLRGIAFGSFAGWQHVANDIFYARLRVGGTRATPKK